MPAGCFDPWGQDAHFFGSFLKSDSGVLMSSFLTQFHLLHSTPHKHGRSLFHLVAFSALFLRDCLLGTKLRKSLLSSGWVQQEKTVRRMQMFIPVCKSPVNSKLSIPSLHQFVPRDPQSRGPGNFLAVSAELFGCWLSSVVARHPHGSWWKLQSRGDCWPLWMISWKTLSFSFQEVGSSSPYFKESCIFLVILLNTFWGLLLHPYFRISHVTHSHSGIPHLHKEEGIRESWCSSKAAFKLWGRLWGSVAWQKVLYGKNT